MYTLYAGERFYLEVCQLNFGENAIYIGLKVIYKSI